MSSKQTYLRAIEMAKKDQGNPLPAEEILAGPKSRPRFGSPRRETLVFVSLGAENPDSLGNVCKVGPAFKGMKRLAPDQKLNVIFKLPGVESWMNAAAKVVWVSTSGQSGGLELVDIADESRRLIDNWLALRGQSDRSDTNAGSRVAQAAAASAVRGSEVDSYQIVLPVNAIEITPGPQPQPQASAPVAARVNARPAAPKVAPSIPKSAAVSRPAAPPNLPAAAPSIPDQTQGMEEEGIKIDRKTARMFGLALIGFVAISFLAGAVLGRIRSGLQPGPPTVAQRVVSTAPVVPRRPPVTATQNSVEPLPAQTAMALAPVRTSPFDKPAQKLNSLKSAETPSLQGTSNLAVDPAKSPNANRPAPARQIVHPVAPSAPVPRIAEPRPATVPAVAAVEPHPTLPSNPISVRAAEPAIAPAVVDTAPAPAAAAAVNSETLTGSIEIIPDLYPSIRMPAQSKTKPAAPAALTVGRLLSRTEPVYPPDALRQRISGTVKLHVVLGADGRVQTAAVADGPTQLSDEALQAVKQWRYEPTLLGSAPVEAEEDIVVIFRIASSH